MTSLAFGLLGLLATGSVPVALVMFAFAGVCVAGVLRWVRHRQHPPAEPAPGTLWAGPATVRVANLLQCPLLDTVTVKRPGAARRRPARGAPGDLVMNAGDLRWTATLAAEMGGVKGSFVLPWASVVKAQAAVIPSRTPGSGAIALSFADGSKLDLALIGNYPGFRAALTRLPTPLSGLAD